MRVAPGIDDLTWLRREIGMARELGRPIFPIVLPGAGPIELEQLGVGRIQALRLAGEEPPETWVRSVHDALYPATATTPSPVWVQPDRRGDLRHARCGRLRQRRAVAVLRLPSPRSWSCGCPFAI